MNYNKGIYIESKIPEEEVINLDEKNTKQNGKKSNNMKNVYNAVNNINNINMNGINFLLDQSNPELYNHIKNNLTSNNQNLNILNYNQSQKITENNDSENNNILKKTSNNNQKDFKNPSLTKSNISTKKVEIQKQLILSGDLFYNKKIKITSKGLENTNRTNCKNNNIFPIYFGTELDSDSNGVPYNDFIVNFGQNKKVESIYSNNTGKNKSNSIDKGGRIFKIIYDKYNEYYLSFMHSSLLLYYRISNRVYLENDKEYYFILGNVFISILVQSNGENNKVNVKIEIENQKAEKTCYENEKKIKIGREEDNDIEIDIQCISKYHSVIEYDDDKKLYYYKDNNSTNGSTLLIKEDDIIPLNGLMHFKLEDISFTIKETELEK
jgi:hypothetical protein